MGKDRLLVSCRILVAAAMQFGAEEVEALLAHVRSCKPGTRLPETPGVEAVLKHFDVRRTDEREWCREPDRSNGMRDLGRDARRPPR